MPNYAFASHCSSFAYRCYALASLCFSMPLLFRCCVMHGRTVHSNAMAYHSRTTLYLALACQSFARPLSFIELRFHELHFLCITPPICALLCLYLSLLIDARPLLCCSNQHLRTSQSFTGSLCHCQCYS